MWRTKTKTQVAARQRLCYLFSQLSLSFRIPFSFSLLDLSRRLFLSSSPGPTRVSVEGGERRLLCGCTGRWMAQPGSTEVGNWQSSETSYPQSFEEKRKQRASAAPSKRKDPRPALPKEDGDVRRSPAPARVEGLSRTSQPNPRHQRHAEQGNYGNVQKIQNKMNGGGQPPLRPAYTGKSGRSPMNSERRVPQEGVPGKRRNPGGGYAAQQPDTDVIVPPFPSDGMDQADAEKYTGVFDIVAQRTPYTPNNNSQKQDDKKKKQHGAWARLLHCFCGESGQ